ncbi:hypothetical protein GQ53DRAFT_421628 [Thozetella sp. PMI_491]|nr:hypothetical protein GQ53DRAFT_421628 [Thozetella sp. PMI_491]
MHLSFSHLDSITRARGRFSVYAGGSAAWCTHPRTSSPPIYTREIWSGHWRLSSWRVCSNTASSRAEPRCPLTGIARTPDSDELPEPGEVFLRPYAPAPVCMLAWDLEGHCLTFGAPYNRHTKRCSKPRGPSSDLRGPVVSQKGQQRAKRAICCP